MRRILVTGGCGFVGSNFLNFMLPKYPADYYVNLDCMYYCASQDNLIPYTKNHDHYKFIEGNINDRYLVQYILRSENITHIIHFAAQSHVDNSFENSLQYTSDNVMGTHTILEAIRIVNKEILFLHFSTDEVYGESQLNEDPKHEASILCPTNPYAASKAAAEMYVTAYHHSYGLKTIITRGNNIYGPHQYPEKLIPKFIQALQKGEKCTIHGDGSSIRSFIHVDDVCTAVEIILENGAIGEIYNIGSNPQNEKTVLQVAEFLVKQLKPSDQLREHILFVTDRPFNDKRYFITNEKLSLLGWTPTITFENGVRDLLRSTIILCDQPQEA